MTEPRAVGNIIVVNDDLAQLCLFAGLLQNAGYTTRSFRSANEALAALPELPAPDLLITDLYMPGIDGWRLCRLARSPEFPALNHTAILVVSATFAGDEAARITAELGANAFLPVPVESEKFLEIVASVLKGEIQAHRKRILVVEDEPALAELAFEGFSAHGYEVDLAMTAAEGVAKCEACAPDIIVLDYHLPDALGDTLLVEFRKRRPSAPVVMVTADPRPGLAQEWMNKGASGYARKPYQMDYLIHLCERAHRERALLRVEEILEQRTRQLREQEEKFHAVADFTGDWEYWIGPDGNFCYVSPACERITGYRPEEFRSDPSLLLRVVHPEDRDAVRSRLQPVNPSRQADHFEFRLLSREGKTLWIDHRCQSVCREDGTYLGHRAANSDITEQKSAQRDLSRTQAELLQTSRLAGMAEVATSILHNVGNVLSSVNVSATLISDQLRRSKSGNLKRVAELLHKNESTLADFIANDSKGRHLPHYIEELASHLEQEQVTILDELDSLRKNVEHIKEIITTQQNYAKVAGLTECVQITDLVNDAIRMNEDGLTRHKVRVVRDFDPESIPSITVEKHKVLQILVNLISNAAQACSTSSQPERILTLRARNGEGAGMITLWVIDNGSGISPENLPRIFGHGFTTKKEGHGFGLHSGALCATELGGALRAHSDGLGRGATFILELPVTPPARQQTS